MTSEPKPSPEGHEIRVFGPPGTGKTTYLAARVQDTAKHRHTDRLIVSSFTVAAAKEIAGRGLPLSRGQVGTLHALAYRAIGHPAVAQEQLAEWNEMHPGLALSQGYRDVNLPPDQWVRSTDGDALLMQVESLRGRMVPEELWPAKARAFRQRWEVWKTNLGVVDFTDMIELALTTTECAPGDPVVGFFDEVQDFTPQELALVRHWGQSMERLVLAGDDDQCLYRFKGSTPDAFLDPPLPDDQKRILGQSYRVPFAVHAVAQAWVETLSRREPKDYLPRDAEGLVRTAAFKYGNPEAMIPDLLTQLDAGRSVMVLGTCGYMIDPLKHALKAAGIPFGNPYRQRGDWNPLKSGRGVSSAEKVLAYLILDERTFGEASRLWTGQDVQRWSALVKKQGVFRRGAGKLIAELPDRELTYEEIASLFDDDEQLERAVLPDLEWLASNILGSQAQTAAYPIKVARRFGPNALSDEPQLCVGTVHSVKGGQSDVVFLYPDLSMAGMREWAEPGEARDSVVRLFYVGMTRAREELVVCQPSGPLTVDVSRMLKGAAK